MSLLSLSFGRGSCNSSSAIVHVKINPTTPARNGSAGRRTSSTPASGTMAHYTYLNDSLLKKYFLRQRKSCIWLLGADSGLR